MMTFSLLTAILCSGALLIIIVLAVVIALQNRQSGLDHTTASRISPHPPVENGAFTPGSELSLYDRVKDSLRQGNRIEAVNAYLEATGASLREAEVAIDRIERGVNGPRQVGPDYPPAEDLRSRVIDMLRKGRKIEAIKIYREATGEGLKEAKDAVEDIERTL